MRRAAAAAGVLAAAAIVIVVLTGGGAPRRPRPLSPRPPSSALQLGANVGRLFNGHPYSAAEIDAQLAALRAAGATLARADAPWELSEPLPPQAGIHHYDWAFDDEVAGALAAHGLRWLPILDYSAPWAQSVPGQDHSPPNSPQDYVAYAASVARRYGPGGSFWRSHPQLRAQPVDVYEIWNEPDSALFWSVQPAAPRYAELYLAARAAVKAVQPGVRVIVGGLAHPSPFIPALLRAAPALAGQLDGVAIHPYGATPQAVLANVRSARAALDAAAVASVPLYVTEVGWTTRPRGALDYLRPALRPSYIAQTLSALGHLDCGVAAVLLYAWITPERVASDPNEWFGISPPEGGSSPDVRAFAQGLRDALAPAPAISCG